MDLEALLPADASRYLIGETGLLLVEGFCTPEEARLVIERGRPRLEASTVALGEELVVADNRSSFSGLILSDADPAAELEPLLQRLAALAQLPAAHSEGLWVVHYRPGQGYGAHRDYYRPADHAPMLEDWGNRLVTVLLYLNDVEDGGETEFAELNLRVRPRCGRALAWLNVDADGTLHRETLHASLPLGSGEKWALNAWFRERPALDRPAEAFVRRSAPPGRPLPPGASGLPAGVELLK
jgi:prolyl 4-hydroxylase